MNSSYRMRSRELNYPPALTFAANLPTTVTNHEPMMGASIPENLELTTFEALSQSSVLIRVTHIFGPEEHPTLSSPVTVTWGDLLGPAAASRISKVTEMLASADAPLGSVQRLAWKIAGEGGAEVEEDQFLATVEEPLTLYPTDVRTFVLDI